MKRSEARQEFLLDVFVTAMEGGIGYWSACHEYHWEAEDPLLPGDLYGFYAKVREWDEENGEYTGDLLLINDAVIARGINLILKGEVKLNSEIKDWIAKDSRLNECGMIDACAADCIVQAGLFGKIVYG
jgi:hypothetical protein